MFRFVLPVLSGWRVERTGTLYLDKNRYAIRGDASISTYTATPNKSALLAQRDGGGHVAHANGGDVEKERLCMLQK